MEESSIKEQRKISKEIHSTLAKQHGQVFCSLCRQATPTSRVNTQSISPNPRRASLTVTQKENTFCLHMTAFPIARADSGPKPMPRDQFLQRPLTQPFPPLSASGMQHANPLNLVLLKFEFLEKKPATETSAEISL